MRTDDDYRMEKTDRDVLVLAAGVFAGALRSEAPPELVTAGGDVDVELANTQRLEAPTVTVRLRLGDDEMIVSLVVYNVEINKGVA